MKAKTTKKATAKISYDDDVTGPDPVDRHVGSRLRTLRKLKQISQEKLANELGLTFQQVQKYERADNRIGASRLYKIAKALNVPVSHFFEDYSGELQSGFADETKQASFGSDLMTDANAIKLLRIYAQLRDDEVKSKQFMNIVATFDRPKK